MKITKHLAQKIVSEMMKAIPYNIDVMDERGVVIGSGQIKKLGNFHQGGLDAIEKKRMVEIVDAETKNQIGVNEPIIINNNVVGVVAITGDPNEVKPFSKLVRASATVLVEQVKIMRDYQIKEKHLEEFLFSLAYGKSQYDDEVYSTALEFGIDLNHDHVCVMLEGSNLDTIEKKLKAGIKPPNYYLRLDVHKIALFLDALVLDEKMISCLEKMDEIEKIGVGDMSKPFSSSFERAIKSIEVGKRLNNDRKIYYWDDFEFLSGLYHSNKDKYVNVIQNLEKSGEKLELIKTLQAYIDENGEINEVALRLNIHRNTLNYRLNKIKELTGKNPKKLFDLVELIGGLIWN